ncbi:zinc finger protein 513-like [Penaeus japonicus]|uniref:zinc finger protein 513-like n=1 Tax=Penaeus japonicus TaxID=27405 RepID=UPI001C713221|nr:zinc finger protein 513-like [Penaeus japonicus]
MGFSYKNENVFNNTHIKRTLSWGRRWSIVEYWHFPKASDGESIISHIKIQVDREDSYQWTDDRRRSQEWQGTASTSKVHQCPHCSYTTVYIHILKRHILKHTGEKPFTCPYCSYDTTRSDLLKEHIYIHTGQKPFSCPFCPYTATRKNIMRIHISKHSGEKPYACTYCPYRASKNSSLKSHMLTHKAKTHPS